MRCRGLTSDHHRCTAESVRTTDYCEAHQATAAEGDTLNVPPPLLTRSGIVGLVRKFRATANSQVPDDARFEIPAFLKKSSTPQVIDHLLNSPDVMVRWCSAFALRKRRERAAIEPLWKVLQSDLSSLVRQQCAVALGKIGTTAVLGALIEALWHDSDPGVRQACAIALGNLGYGVAAPDLARSLERERSVFVRWDVVLALGQVGDRVLEPLLTELSDNDKSTVVRSASREALDDIRRRYLHDGG